MEKGGDMPSSQKEDAMDDVLALKRDISTHSFFSPNSDKISERKMNLTNKPFTFTEEDTTFKPPKHIDLLLNDQFCHLTTILPSM